jgi:hypothetical protein
MTVDPAIMKPVQLIASAPSQLRFPDNFSAANITVNNCN